MNPKVGIIGKGEVGSAIKRGLERAGYKVKSVGKDPKAVGETASWADMIVLAIPFSAVDDTVKEIGSAADGKTLIDVTNVYTPDAMAMVGSKSGAQYLQGKLPRANVVKTLNMHFSKNMDTGHIEGQQLTLFAAGDDKEARSQALQLGRDLGFDAVDAGTLANAKLLELMGNFIIQLGYGEKLGIDIGFKLVRAKQ